MGHFNPVTAPGWWADVFRVIYSFHMPAFMFLSGLLYSMTRKIASVPSSGLSRSLLCVGRCSFFIYLFHTTFAEVTKVVLAKVGVTTDNCFLLCLAAFTVVGMAVPMLLQIFVVERVPLLASVFGTGTARK